MWKPDYSATPGGGGQIGKTTATGQTSIADAKFYVMNSTYEVFKCLYNGEDPSNTTGQDATEEPSTAAAATACLEALEARTIGRKSEERNFNTSSVEIVYMYFQMYFAPVVSV